MEKNIGHPWNDGVRGLQVLPLINNDAATIRVEAGPGTGKTFGLVRRVCRLLHPEGGNFRGSDILIVAFNRVIAQALQRDIDEELAKHPHDGTPTIRTVHGLCLQLLGTDLRLLLPHEREAMIYDVLHTHSELRQTYKSHAKADQALRDHEARHADHIKLWQAVQGWLIRHRCRLISELPSIVLDRMKAGDFSSKTYQHVIVDEFQDLTAGEQEVFMRLCSPTGTFVALGDPRQSIYAFRGNDREGLAKLETLIAPHGRGAVIDMPMSECQRCPADIVAAANQLMGLYPTNPMLPGSSATPNTHVVFWDTPHAEAIGMASAIVRNIRDHPDARHLVMVTRRQFGYWLRDEIVKLDPELKVDLSFSESLLETWAVREAFLLLCLLVDADAPTWRAWLGYRNSTDGKNYKATERSAPAYLLFFTREADKITQKSVQELVGEKRTLQRGKGGATIWDRAYRYLDLVPKFDLTEDPEEFIRNVFEPSVWIGADYADAETARLDMQLLSEKAIEILADAKERYPDADGRKLLEHVARRLRYQIATREPFVPGSSTDVQVATLWGAKGVTADHVYVLGLSREMLPGTKREEYPGTDQEYWEEQRRLFYVSLTRSKRTLVLSRATRINRQQAARLGIGVAPGWGYMADLAMCPFLHDIITLLPSGVAGSSWTGP